MPLRVISYITASTMGTWFRSPLSRYSISTPRSNSAFGNLESNRFRSTYCTNPKGIAA
jgi:hypothetical protein